MTTLPYELKYTIAKYVPIDWSWVNKDNDPVCHMGLSRDDYNKLYKLRASRETRCICLNSYVLEKKVLHDHEPANRFECKARTHFCQCAGDINITSLLNYREIMSSKLLWYRSYLDDNYYFTDVMFHYSLCKASKHINGCHCKYRDCYYNRNDEIKCPSDIKIHNCICETNFVKEFVEEFVEECRSWHHICICQNGSFKCKAFSHLCSCLNSDNCLAIRHIGAIINNIVHLHKGYRKLDLRTDTLVHLKNS